MEDASNVDTKRVLDEYMNSAVGLIGQLFALDPKLSRDDRAELVAVLDRLAAGRSVHLRELPESLRVARTSRVIFRGPGNYIYFQSARFHTAWKRVRSQYK